MPARSIRVLVVEDYEPFQRFVASILQKQPELQIICKVSDGLEAVQKAEELQPDIIVLDIGLPCLALDFLDTELSVFMQQLRVQGAAGEPGWA
jgi:chemotaxis response regulator CheB